MKWVSVIFGVVQDYVKSVIPHRDIKLRVNRWRFVLTAGLVDAVYSLTKFWLLKDEIRSRLLNKRLFPFNSITFFLVL